MEKRRKRGRRQREREAERWRWTRKDGGKLTKWDREDRVFRVFLRSKVNAREANPPRSFCTVYYDLKSIYVRPPRRSALIIHGQKKLTINDRVESARLISGFPAAKLMKHTTRNRFSIFVIHLSLVIAFSTAPPTKCIGQPMGRGRGGGSGGEKKKNVPASTARTVDALIRPLASTKKIVPGRWFDVRS